MFGLFGFLFNEEWYFVIFLFLGVVYGILVTAQSAGSFFEGENRILVLC